MPLLVITVLALLVTYPVALSAQAQDPLAVYRSWSLPSWVLGALGSQFRTDYEWHDRVNPFYQRADFDGDGQVDVAVLVRHKATRKVGIAFVHRGTQSVHIVGAGTALGNGGDDFSWLGVWRVFDQVDRSVAGARGELLLVEKPESAGGLIYWDGSKYQWLQHGD